MSWEEDYTRMREVARLAGWETPEQLYPPTEGITVPHAEDKFGAYWSLLTEPLMLERFIGNDIMHIYPDGNVQHREMAQPRPTTVLEAAKAVKAHRDIYSFGPLFDPPWDVERTFLAEDQRDA